MNTIITIGRQFGSGGREIGKKVAEYFDIKFYDKDLLTRAKGRRQAKDAKPGRQTSQEIFSGSDKQDPHKAGQWDEDCKRRFDSVLDQDFFQEQDGEDGYKVDVHVCQTVR